MATQNVQYDQIGIALRGQGQYAVNGIAAATSNQIIKPGPGRVVRINVTTAGSTAGSVFDSANAAGATAANLIFSIPNTVGTYYLDWPCANGIVVTTGTAQVASVSYS